MHRQATDKQPTIATDKEMIQPPKTVGLQPNLAMGKIYCGNTVIREKVTRGNVYPSNTTTSNSLNTPILKKPKDQTVDEWLSDYDESYFLENGHYLKRAG